MVRTQPHRPPQFKSGPQIQPVPLVSLQSDCRGRGGLLDGALLASK